MASLAPESQASAVVDALLDAPATAALTAHLDDVLAWLAQGPAAEGAIGRELEGRSLDPRHVRSLALGRLDEFLFVDGRGPLRALGLPSDASRDRVKLRYRLLMRVYHPDRMGDSADSFGDRAARINDAYHEYVREAGRRRAPRPARPVAAAWRRSAASRASAHRRRRLRQALGDPESLRRRALLGLLVLGGFVVMLAAVHTRSSGPVRIDPVEGVTAEGLR